MSAFSLIDLQLALYKLLSEDPFLVAQSWGVFDHVPDQQLPVKYFVLGDEDAEPFDTKTSLGLTIRSEIHSWCRARGKKDILEGVTRVYDLLHEKPFEVAGQQVIISRQEFSTVIKDTDGTTFHGIQRFHFTITPITE